MKANELRIGNWVKRNGIVVQCDYMSVANCHAVPEQYESIPLTEEWLFRFGFEIDHNYLNSMKGLTTSIVYKKDKLQISNPKYGFILFHYHTNIQYLHQLQNLYYSITGQELELKQS